MRALLLKKGASWGATEKSERARERPPETAVGMYADVADAWQWSARSLVSQPPRL